MSSPSIQVDGVQTKEMIDVFYTGSDTLKPGQLLCYDWNYAGYTSGTTAENLTENIRRRASYVEKPSLDNIDHIAGYVAFGQPNLTGPRVIKIIPFEGQIDRAAYLYGNLSFTAGDLLGLAPGSYNVSKWTVGPVLGIVQETVDRSTTAGTLRAWFGQLNISQDVLSSKRFFFADDFCGPNQVSSAANGTLAGFNTYIATGTASTYPMKLDAQGGYIQLTTDATGSRPASIQLNGEPVSCTANKPCFFRARFTKDVITTNSKGFIGLSITDASLNASDPSDYIAFKTAAAVFTLESRKASGTKATLATGNALVANTYKDVAFYWDGNATIYAWEDGVAMTVTLSDSTRPILGLTLSAEVYDTAAAANIMTIDRWSVANAR